MIRAALVALLALACADSGLSVTLTPETAEVEAALVEADARWERAGVAADRIVIGPGGSPVRLDASIGNMGDTVITGRGHEYVGVRRITLGNLAPNLVAHELGHVLGINTVALDEEHPLDGAECDAGAANRPTMCAHVGSVITTADLELACSVGACVGFTPESE
jgi:hypothetical protein